jgi:AcrR family transcriptional regulator
MSRTTSRTPLARTTPKAEETRRRILTAALDLFQERGFAETTMRDIARGADVATGAAYYYFPSKESIVMAFYWETHVAFDAAYQKRLAQTHDLARRIRILIELKIEQFQPYREFLGALFRSAGDPASPLSPFSAETQEIRDQSIGHFRSALEGSNVRTPPDLSRYLPYLLWLYQMGIVLFWIYDRSARQAKTGFLLEKTSVLIAQVIKISSFRILKPLRETAIGILARLVDDGSDERSRP